MKFDLGLGGWGNLRKGKRQLHGASVSEPSDRPVTITSMDKIHRSVIQRHHRFSGANHTPDRFHRIYQILKNYQLDHHLSIMMHSLYVNCTSFELQSNGRVLVVILLMGASQKECYEMLMQVRFSDAARGVDDDRVPLHHTKQCWLIISRPL